MTKGRAKGGGPGQAAAANPAAAVAKAILEKFGDAVAKKAVMLSTPIPKMQPLANGKPSTTVKAFIEKYLDHEDPALYPSQVLALKALHGEALPNVVMTTATGSGKSLAFWAWIIEALSRDPGATALACFPTQALLWGQAERLRKISEPESLCCHGSKAEKPAYAGVIVVGKHRIPWTVWHGTQKQRQMEIHEDCTSCRAARIRITTVDKAHWSLLRRPKNAPFFSGLAAVVIDEAHVWQGVAGANVRGFLNRVHLSCDVLNKATPSFFLASATLQDPEEFAESLTGRTGFVLVDDKIRPTPSLIEAKDVPAALERATTDLRRYVLLVKPEPDAYGVTDIVGDEAIMGKDANALCFVQSKFSGHLIKRSLDKETPDREAIAYDASMTGEDRRAMERRFGNSTIRGITVIATSALEVGVDLQGLDVAVIDELPPRRADLLQRLGRVGRSGDHPGLGVLCLSDALLDQRLLDAPAAVLSLEGARPLPLPLHLESIRLRMMRACFAEWIYALTHREHSWDNFNAALDRHFGGHLHFKELETQIKEQLGDLVDLDDGSWYYKGFRASTSQGKRDLVLEGTREPVAVVEDIAVFRDAHPEGVYLGHRGQRYRVVSYRGEWKQAEWSHPDSNVILGKFMKTLEDIVVVEEKRQIATRGRWRDSFIPETESELPDGAVLPKKKNTLSFGVWSFLRKFSGYVEIDLTGRAKSKLVPLAEVARRFATAREAGQHFPFLHDFSYRTLGWRWEVATILPDANKRRELGPVIEGLLLAFLCEAVECAHSDLGVSFAADEAEIRVVDGTPGGNGLSAALLEDGRVPSALSEARQALRPLIAKKKRFARFLVDECQITTEAEPKDISDAIDRLASAWPG